MSCIRIGVVRLLTSENGIVFQRDSPVRLENELLFLAGYMVHSLKCTNCHAIYDLDPSILVSDGGAAGN